MQEVVFQVKRQPMNASRGQNPFQSSHCVAVNYRLLGAGDCSPLPLASSGIKAAAVSAEWPVPASAYTYSHLVKSNSVSCVWSLQSGPLKGPICILYPRLGIILCMLRHE